MPVAVNDESEMQRLEAEIRDTRARVDDNIHRLQSFIDAWRDFIAMFTVANARDKAGGVFSSLVSDVGEKADSLVTRLKDSFKR